MFYATEIALREQLKYPPFCDIIVISFNGSNEADIKNKSDLVYRYLKDKLESYKILEDSINKSIVNAEKTSDNIKRLAREEANVIVSDAKNNASRIVNDALIRSERIEQQADVLERNIKIFKRKLKIIVEQQLAVVEEIEVLDLDES